MSGYLVMGEQLWQRSAAQHDEEKKVIKEGRVPDACLKICVGITLFGLIIGLRLPLITPVITPDSRLYLLLADNVILNQCYSRSDPQLAQCIPSWEGQAPGYPLFIAAVKLIAGADPVYIVIAQLLVFASAAVYALLSFYSWHKCTGCLIISGVILAVSPITIAWPRWVLTETLAAATSLWFFAEILRSLGVRKLRVLPLSMAIAAGVLVRWDQVCLLVPAALCAFYLVPLKGTLWQFSKIAAAAALPIMIMATRAAALGLAVLPPLLSNSSLPKGAVEFWQHASLNQNATSGFLWRIWDKEYDGIAREFDYSSILAEFDTAQFRNVLERISTLPQHSDLPAEIDAQLEKLARPSNPRTINFLLPVMRAFPLWSSRDNLYWSGWIPLRHGTKAEMVAHVYRMMLLLILLSLILLTKRRERIALASLLSYVASRTLFLTSLTALEIRYLTPMLPAMEIILLPLLCRVTAGSQNRGLVPGRSP